MAAFDPAGVIELEGHLLTRVDSLRGYVATKIPPALASVLSAEDILQETLVAAFQNVGSFVPNGPDALDRWLITIANRKLIDALKRAQRAKRGGPNRILAANPRRSSSLSGLMTRIAATWRTPSREVSMRETADAINSALSNLRADRRSAILMRFVEGLSLKQISEKMGKSYAAVNSLLFHGLRDLRTRLGHAGRFFSDARSADSEATPAGKSPPL